MMNRNLKFGKRPIAFLLSLMLLLPSVALAKDTDNVDETPKTEVVQVDLEAEIEKALQEDGNLEDNLQVIVGESGEDVSEDDSIESEKEISARGVEYPVKELYIIGVRGSYNGLEQSELINCGKGRHIADNASAITYNKYNKYNKNVPLTITVQYVGTHMLSQKQTTTGDIYMKGGAPYDHVLNGLASTAFKMDYVLTPRDTQAEQTVFEFEYTPYQSNGINIYPGKYYRRLTVKWADAISDVTPPASVMYNPFTTTVSGLNDTMEYSRDGEEWFSMPSGSTQLDVYLLLGYQRGANLYVRYKATDTTLPSA